MTNFGFSIYPERHGLEKCQSYIDLMERYGARRIFISLLQIGPDNSEVFDLYRSVISYANQKRMLVIADISPGFIESCGWKDSLIEKAHAFGVAGIRLDEALPLEEIVSLTQNPYQLKIELNMSTDKRLLTDLLQAGANRENIIACHNFYPHEYTALSEDYFLEMSEFYRQEGITSAAFVTSQTATEGPWPLSEGLPTLEEHRHQELARQIAWIKATGLIDWVLISNQFVIEEELESIQEVLDEDILTFRVQLAEHVTDIEREIIDFSHNYRGDISAYVIRSTMPRIVYKDNSIPAQTDGYRKVEAGTVIIDNDLYGRYKGELHIVIKELELSPKANIVGTIHPEDWPLVSFLKPWQAFRLKVV